MIEVTYLEGGSREDKDVSIACRMAFRKLFERMGLKDRMPALKASGSRSRAFNFFRHAISEATDPSTIALLIDSEEIPGESESPWAFLARADGWVKPEGVTDDQVFLMVACQETWVVACRTVLIEHYGQHLHQGRLPSVSNLEALAKEDIQEKLGRATERCGNAYRKGKRSFEVVGKLDPIELAKLPSFARMRRILTGKA